MRSTMRFSVVLLARVLTIVTIAMVIVAVAGDAHSHAELSATASSGGRTTPAADLRSVSPGAHEGAMMQVVDPLTGDRPIFVLGTNWYIHDTGTGTYGANKWGQNATAPDLVEPMDQTAPTQTGSNQLLFEGSLPYYAAGAQVTTNYRNTDFAAILWLKNTTSQSNTVTVKLYKGDWNTDGSITETSLLAQASQTLTSQTLSAYTFDFGRPAEEVSSFSNERLIMKITCSNAGRTRIYWDDNNYPSRLHGTPVFETPGPCPGHAFEEGEPVPFDEYIDEYNGGCDSSPPVFQYCEPSDPGADQTYCGTSGTFLLQGEPARDTDWYEVSLDEGGELGFSVIADFPVQIVLIDGNYGCEDPPILELAVAAPGDHQGVYAEVAAGTYWLWVGPESYEGVPPGAEYLMRIVGNWRDPDPAVCCIGGDCLLTFEQECLAMGGDWYPYLYSCDPNPCPPEFPLAWYFDDTGVTGWGQTYTPPKWEWMDYGPLPDCHYQDLDVENPYYACSPPLSGDYSGHRFYAEIWLDNNYPDHANAVTLELRRGSWGNQGTLLASATTDCITYMGNPPPGKYLYDFGVIENLNLQDESLIVKIIYTGEPGDTHLYWDGPECPSGLRAAGPSNPGPDTLLCELQRGEQPTPPHTFWYDVTPGDAGRCDFHVQVFDPDPTNYTNVSLPAATWQFAVHPVGDSWWASWWDPGCENAIFDTFRFQFQNTSGAVWSEWTTTIGASSHPYLDVVDFTGRHFLEPDGYGGRVHVPDGVHVHYLDHDVGDCRLTMTDQGILGFMDDTQAQGAGLVYPREGGANLLFVGSLWVGLEPDYVANRDYNADPAKEWQVTTTPDGRCWETGHGVSHQDIHATYDDAALGAPRGLVVDQTSYAWGSNHLATDHVMVAYTLLNGGNQTLSEIYVGCFLDLDLDDYTANTGGVAPEYCLAYMTGASGSPDAIHAGVMLLQDQGQPPAANVTLIENPTFVWPSGYVLDADKYGFLSAGGSQYVITDGSAADDYGVLASAGPYELAPGESRRVCFAVVGGETYDEFILHARIAQMIHTQGFAEVPDPDVPGADTHPADPADPTDPGGPNGQPRMTRLHPARPNPFCRDTSIRFELKQSGRIELDIYDTGGRRLKSLASGWHDAGSYGFSWDGMDEMSQPVAGGVYFLKLQAPDRQETRRLIRLR